MNRLSRYQWIGLAAIVIALSGAVLLAWPQAIAYEDEDESEGLGQVQAMRELLALMHEFEEVTSDRTITGVAAVMMVQDHIGDPHQVIEVLTRLRSQVDDRAIQRAITIKLMEFYGHTDQPKERLREFENLVLDKIVE